MTKYDTIRTNTAAAYAANTADCGRFGRIKELELTRSNSRKTKSAPAGKADSYAKFMTANGTVRYVPIEVKTNGGRIGNITAPYVVYCLDVCNSGTQNKRRHVPDVIIPTKIFLDFLYEHGLVKSTNGAHPEPAIQCTSKILYTALLDWCIPYDKDAIYTADDFDGLTL